MTSDFEVFENNVVMTELDGKGVVVGEKILTACHCISLNLWWDPSLDRKREPSLETNPMVKLTTATGKEFLANIEFADPISDLVILGCPDGSSFPHEAKAYEKCAPWSPIEVYLDGFELNATAHIRNRDGTWTQGDIYAVFPNRVSLDAKEKVLPGASGGPVVLDGKLLAVVSNTSEDGHDDAFNGVHPLLAKTLPRWWGE